MKFTVLLLAVLSCAAFIGSSCAAPPYPVSEHGLPLPLLHYQKRTMAIDVSWTPLILAKYGFIALHDEEDKHVVDGWVAWYTLPTDWTITPDSEAPNWNIISQRTSGEVLGRYKAEPYDGGVPAVRLTMLNDLRYHIPRWVLV